MHTNHPNTINITKVIKTKFVLPSENWFSGFTCNPKTKTVCFNYRDRRRDGQIARKYTIKFNNELKVTDITEAIAENYSDTDQWEATDKAKTIMMEIDDDDDDDE